MNICKLKFYNKVFPNNQKMNTKKIIIKNKQKIGNIFVIIPMMIQMIFKMKNMNYNKMQKINSYLKYMKNKILVNQIYSQSLIKNIKIMT